MSLNIIMLSHRADEMTEEEKVIAKAIDNHRRRERGEQPIPDDEDHRLDSTVPGLAEIVNGPYSAPSTSHMMREDEIDVEVISGSVPSAQNKI